jgi:hypothetical protein
MYCGITWLMNGHRVCAGQLAAYATAFAVHVSPCVWNTSEVLTEPLRGVVVVVVWGAACILMHWFAL